MAGNTAPGDRAEKIDSLKQILHDIESGSVPQKYRAQILNNLALYYSRFENDTSLKYGKLALKEATSKGDAQQKLFALAHIADIFHQKCEYDSADRYYRRIYHINNKSGSDEDKANACLQLADNYYQWSKYDESKIYLDKAASLFVRAGNYNGYANALKTLGAIYSNWGEYDKAIAYLQNALQMVEESGDLNGISRACNSIGMLFKDWGKLDKSLEFFKRALDIAQSLNDEWSITNLNLHIGDIYLRKKEYRTALNYYLHAEQLEKKIGHKKLRSIALSNIGEAYKLMGDYQKALDYQQLSLAIKRQIADNKRIAISLYEIGTIYNELGNFEQAVYQLNSALQVSLEINFKNQVMKCYQSLAEVHANLGDSETALEFMKQYVRIRDEIYNDESDRRLAEIQTQYETERKEKENQVLRKNEQLNKEKIKNQRLIIIFSVILMLFIIIIALFFYYQNKSKKRINSQLSAINAHVEQQKEDMENLNKQLEEANATKDKFFSIVAHDLKNPLGSLIGFSNLLREDYDDLDDDEKKKIIGQIVIASENTFELLQDLLDWARAQSGKIQLSLGPLQVKSLVDEIVLITKPNAEKKNISIETKIDEAHQVFADKNTIKMVLNNLLSNAVKFTPLGGKIEVQSEFEKNGYLRLTVSDTGIGISEENLQKLFRIDHKMQMKGTDGETGTGLGLLLCKEFIEKNQGTIQVESAVNKGSTFIITLPTPNKSS